MEIFFQSTKPISFCAKRLGTSWKLLPLRIEFLDNESGSYVLPVSGTTENCILTCHSYLHNNTDFYTMEGDPVGSHFLNSGLCQVMLTEKEDLRA